VARILYFVSGHGFGHAVRSAQVVRALSVLGHSCEIVSSAPRWIFEANLKGVAFGHRDFRGDVGVAQVDSIRNDLPATLAGWRELLAASERWLERGLKICRAEKPAVIVSDVVPLAFPLARRAGIASALVATFTWDWILEHYADDNPAFREIAGLLRELYLQADRMIYTPFAYGLPALHPAHEVSLIGKRAAASKAEIRKRLALDSRPAFLVSFGGCGINDVEKMELGKLKDFQFLFHGGKRPANGNIITVPEGSAAHEELVAASDAVITKPGYGICTECTLNRTAMVYTSRGKFAEYGPLSREMQQYFPAVFIPPEELLGGAIGAYLEKIPPFTPAHRMDAGTGATEAARIIAAMAWRPHPASGSGGSNDKLV